MAITATNNTTEARRNQPKIFIALDLPPDGRNGFFYGVGGSPAASDETDARKAVRPSLSGCPDGTAYKKVLGHAFSTRGTKKL